MRKTTKSPGEKFVKDIKRATRKHYSSEEKIRIVLDGLRGDDSISYDGALPPRSALSPTCKFGFLAACARSATTAAYAK